MRSVSEYRKAIVAGIGTGVTLFVSALDTLGTSFDPVVVNWLTGAAAFVTSPAH